MISIHTLLVGQPQDLADQRGAWRSAIYRVPVTGPIALGPRTLDGDQVADTQNHGSPDQAVCCHPIDHYRYWNEVYRLTDPAVKIEPGGVGENWTLDGATERDVCVGDVYAVGTARVQVSAPRYPCSKQERKLQLPGFLRRTLDTMRTGFYLRVLTPGVVQAGDELILEQRPHPELTIERVNACVHRALDPAFAHELLAVPELAAGWKRIVQLKLDRQI